jgi:hypothetical protein
VNFDSIHRRGETGIGYNGRDSGLNMIKSRFLSAMLLVGLSICGTTRGQPGGFHLDLNRPDPKAGEEADRTIQVVTTTCETNSTQGRLTITNSLQFLKLAGRERILSWDVSNDMSKVEIVVNHFVGGNDNGTNQLLTAGDRVVGTSLLGEAFFQSGGRPLSSEVSGQLASIYNLRPHNFNEFAHIILPPLVSIGETWGTVAPMSPAMMSSMGLSRTNGIKGTGELVGTTNLFGRDCFHLRFRAMTTETARFVHEIIESHLPVKMNLQITLTTDLIVPFDESQRILMQSYFMEALTSDEMVIDGRKIGSSQGRTTIRIVSEYRPILHP